MSHPLERLRHHVSGAVARGEAVAITEVVEIDYATYHLCGNCLMVAVNDDDSGVGEDDPAPLHLIESHVRLICPDDSEGYFSWQTCDGCGGLPGDRWDVLARVELPA